MDNHCGTESGNWPKDRCFLSVALSGVTGAGGHLEGNEGSPAGSPDLYMSRPVGTIGIKF